MRIKIALLHEFISFPGRAYFLDVEHEVGHTSSCFQSLHRFVSSLLVSLGVLKWNEWEDTIHMNNDNLEAILANPWTNSPHKKHKLEYFTFTSLAHNTS